MIARSGVGGALALASLVASATVTTQAAGARDRWVATWATAVVARPQDAQVPLGVPLPVPAILPRAPSSQDPSPPFCPPLALPGRARLQPAALNFRNQTLRQIVHVSLGGTQVRVVFSNELGTMPLAVGAAHVARREADAAIQAATDRALTFGGRPSTTIAAGAIVISDPVRLAIPALSDLVVDLYLPDDSSAWASPLTSHPGALQTNYLSADGNHAGDANLTGATPTPSWFFLARVEVLAPRPAGAIAALGDSITDGTRSTPGANSRWPDQLARRLSAQRVRLAVLNKGIAANRVLCDGYGAGVSALARFDRDVLAQPGVKYVIVHEGINDIGYGLSSPVPSAADLIAAHRQLIARAHAAGLAIVGATLTPFEGFAYFTAEGEAKRAALNEFIRNGKAYDGVIDFDAAVRNPEAPTRLQPRFDSGDNLHPNDAGYAAMAAAIDLRLFRASAASALPSPSSRRRGRP